MVQSGRAIGHPKIQQALHSGSLYLEFEPATERVFAIGGGIIEHS